MHASLILLATSLAASVVGAPVPTVSPFESPAPMMVRDANSEAISPVLENLKRQILERLDAIVQRSVSDDVDDDATFEIDKRDDRSLGAGPSHDKRRLASGLIPPGLNTRSDAEDQDVDDGYELDKRRTYDHGAVNKRRTYDHGAVNKRRTYDHGAVNKRQDVDDDGELEKRRTYDHGAVNKRRTYDHGAVNKRQDVDADDELEKRRTYDHGAVNKRVSATEYSALETDED